MFLRFIGIFAVPLDSFGVFVVTESRSVRFVAFVGMVTYEVYSRIPGILSTGICLTPS